MTGSISVGYGFPVTGDTGTAEAGNKRKKPDDGQDNNTNGVSPLTAGQGAEQRASPFRFSGVG